MADFARPVAGHRLRRRIVGFIYLSHGHARCMVLVARLHISRNCQHAKGGKHFIGSPYLLADARNGARTGWPTVLDMNTERSCSPPDWRCLRRLFLDQRLAGLFILGRPSILTRPLGATVGDFLDKPVSDRRTGLKPAHRTRRSSALSSSYAFRAAAESGPASGQSEAAS